MNLWKRASGALKDKNSILSISLSRRAPHRNSDLEAAIIKATSHNDKKVDYRNAQRVFEWICASPVTLKPLIVALALRMERTQSWVVALKGLMLMHGVFCCKTPTVQRIGRLPFDLSNFTDGHSKPSKMWGFNAFVRSYFAFLDQRSALLYEQRKQTEEPMVQELARMQNWQTLLDLLLQIKPLANNMNSVLILEAMDCVIIEIFDIYSRICNGIARVLMGIYSAGKLEATMALRILQKATSQGENLSLYLEFCRTFGVFNATEIPKVAHIPEVDIRDLERIINGVSERTIFETLTPLKDGCNHKATVVKQENAIVDEQKESKAGFNTVITDKWETFDEELLKVKEGDESCDFKPACATMNPFHEVPQDYLLPLAPVPVPAHSKEIPDLITF